MMNRILAWAVAALLSALGPAAEARGQAPAARAGVKWAVVIGVDEYLDPAMTKLSYASSDAWLVAQRLVGRCGYEPNQVLVMTTDQDKAHLRPLRVNLQEQIVPWLERAEAGDTVLIFFAGHGYLDAQGQAYLLPQDCRRDRLGLTGLRTDEVRNMLRQCKATRKLLILDCCHAGSAKGGAPAGPSGQEMGESFRKAEGLITLASCRKSELSLEWDERGHGLFSFYLAEGLGGAADFDRDGIVDSDELYRYVSDKVSATARDTLGGRQTPARLFGEDADGVFALADLGRPSKTILRPGPPGRAPAPPSGIPFPGMTPAPAPAPDTLRRLAERCKVRVNTHWAPFAIAPDGKTLAIAGENHVVSIHEAAGGEERRLLANGNPGGDQGPAFGSLAFSPDGRLLAVFDKAFKGGVKVWDWKEGALLPNQAPLLAGEYPDNARGRFVSDRLLAWNTIAFGPNASPVKLWDFPTGRVGKLAEKDGGGLSALAASPDGRTIAVGHENGRVKLWDATTGQLKKSEAAHGRKVAILACSPRGDLLASAEDDGQVVKLWDVPALKLKASLPHAGTVNALAFCPDGRSILTADRTIGAESAEHLRLWEVGTGRETGSRGLAEGGTAWVQGLAFSADGRTLAAQVFEMKNLALNLFVKVYDYRED